MKIALVGDIGFFGKYSLENNPQAMDQFSEMADYLSSFDYVVGNLEVPFIDGLKAYGAKSAHVSSHPMNIQLLKSLHFTHVCLANNHVYDFAQAGVDSTIAELEGAGIEHFGFDGKTVTIEDAKIALHGYCCYTTNPYGLSQGVNRLDVKQITDVMKTFDKAGYLNIVGSHMGLEHVNIPAYHDIKMARQLAEGASYVLYGHHPHVLQGIEQYKSSLLAYSLGNFCFDDVYTDKSDKPLIKQSDNNKTSVVLSLEVEAGKLIDWSVTPFYAKDDKLSFDIDGVEEKLASYTDYLNTDEQTYTSYRNGLLAQYVAGRKQMRDLNWYIKRLNIGSAVIIARGKYNAWRHKRHKLRYLHERRD